MCLRPNRRASREQPPGPSIASAAPSAAKWTNVQGSAGCESTRLSSAPAISAPANGVHKPISKRTAAPAVNSSRRAGDGEAPVSSPAYTSGMAAATRTSTRPAPGRPPGNVEKSLCTRCLPQRYPVRNACARPKSPSNSSLFRGVWLHRLKIDDSAFQTDRDRMRTIVCSQLGEDVFDVTLDGFLSNGELGRNHLVGIPARD
jgi:hypothetical protein